MDHQIGGSHSSICCPGKAAKMQLAAMLLLSVLLPFMLPRTRTSALTPPYVALPSASSICIWHTWQHLALGLCNLGLGIR